MAFRDWIAAKLGTHMWAVSPRMTQNLAAHGYELTISQKKFTALRREFLDRDGSL